MVIARAKEAKPLKTQKETGRGKTVVHNKSFTGGSTNADYLTARIARDRPDILEGMKAGEYKSVRHTTRAKRFAQARGRKRANVQILDI